MAKRTGRNQNTYDDVIAPNPKTLSSSDWTQVLSNNLRRLGYRVSNDSNSDIYVLEKPFKPNNITPRGFIVWRKSVGTSLVDHPYTGNIWMLAKNGSPTILVDQF